MLEWKVNEISRYKMIKKIGDKLFLAEENARKVLVKFDFEYSIDQGFIQKQYFQSMFIHHECCHPAIAEFIGCAAVNFDLEIGPSIVLSNYQQGSLSSLIERSYSNDVDTRFDATTKIIILYGVASAMNYLHSNNIVNIKLDTTSILLDDNLYPYISGFEESYPIKEEQDTQNPNLTYFESDIDSSSKFKEDIFSFGVLIYNILMNTNQNPDLTNLDLLSANLGNDLERELLLLFKSCINTNIDIRPTFVDILRQIEELALNDHVSRKMFNNYKDYMCIHQSKTFKCKKVEDYVINEMKRISQDDILPYYLNSKLIYLIFFAMLGNTTAAAFIGLIYLGGGIVKLSYQNAYRHLLQSSTKKDPLGFYGLEFMYKNGIIVKKDLKVAFKLAKMSSEKNNSYGHFILGNCFCEGIGCDKNVEEGIKLIKLSVSMNNIVAMNDLAMKYLEGKYVEIDEKEGINLLNKSIGLKSVTALVILGDCYRDRVGVNKDISKAIELYKMAIDQNGVIAYAKLFNVLKKTKPKEALEYLITGARYENTDCLEYLAELYRTGEIVEKDETKAFKLIERSVNQYSDWGQRMITYYYINGIGVEKDVEKGFNLCLMYADDGNQYCQCDMGYFYQHGENCEANRDLAKKYYQMASDQGSDCAITNLNSMLLEEGNTKEAFECCKRAAEHDNPKGLFLYALSFYDDIFVPKSLENAFELAKRAADMGDLMAQLHVAYCYLDNYGVELDDQKYIQYIERAAIQEDVTAMDAMVASFVGGIYNDKDKMLEYCKKGAELNGEFSTYYLGKIYQKGKILSKDFEKALFYYRKSAALDNYKAKKAIRKMMESDNSFE